VILTAIGIVDSQFLTKYWREASVVIFIIAAIITPTWDVLTMTAAALPMVALYLLTLVVIRMIERRQAKAEAREDLGTEE
jgi:sec-independent protein translocase protein TatC